jgi:hypothetical protein
MHNDLVLWVPEAEYEPWPISKDKNRGIEHPQYRVVTETSRLSLYKGQYNITTGYGEKYHMLAE